MESADVRASVGVFDSGVGGLSVLRAIRREVPGVRSLYVADQAHVPYGPRPLAEVRAFSEEIARYLLARGARLIVVACNAASAGALHHLREVFPETPFVGMEPAVKPAAENTRTGKVGVLATPATFQGDLFASVVERFANGVELFTHTCPGLVAEIETGSLEGPGTRAILESALRPMLAEGIDTVVLGCTHYPFVIPLIQRIVGPDVRVIDPAPAVARQVGRVLARVAPDAVVAAPVGGGASVRPVTSGDPGRLSALLPLLLGESWPSHRVRWTAEGTLVDAPA
ncbi:MAG: glutamate racemase [Thermoanaerobaculaceae bacterium]|jgi:glutamate racemase